MVTFNEHSIRVYEHIRACRVTSSVGGCVMDIPIRVPIFLQTDETAIERMRNMTAFDAA
jgi:hypothetical protein